MSYNSINNSIPPQPHFLASYWGAGKLLHLSVFLFLMESYLYHFFLQWAMINQHLFWIILFGCCFLFSFAHIFLVLADGWSRFQDYKRAKDQLFTYGGHSRIFRQYATSQCQRTACITAARELGIDKEAKKYFYDLGYRWHHFLPDFMVNDPFFFYKRYFWKRTFLEKYYKPKYDYHKLSMSLQVQ